MASLATTAEEVIAPFNVESVRDDFPLLAEESNGKPLVYLDNAATTQKPESVIRAIDDYYRHYNANVHRGVHSLSEIATEKTEHARELVRAFLNAKATSEIVFTRGTTEAINLVSNTAIGTLLHKGDHVLISALEHHSNIVPWQLACDRVGAQLDVCPIHDTGEINLDAYAELLDRKPVIVALNHVSNALGTINPVAKMTAMAKAVDAYVLIDGAQATSHAPVDIAEIGCDFYALSGHKMFGPTGIGVLYGREEILDRLPPWQGGGDMIKVVSFDKTEYNELPYKFEAGTPNMAGMIGLGAAIEYLNSLDLAAAYAHEHAVLNFIAEHLADVPGMTVVGQAKEKAGVFSFTVDGVHHHDIGVLLDGMGIAVRTGHHCAMPVMDRFNIAGTTRASLAFYNNFDDAQRFVSGLTNAIDMLR